MILGYTTGVFDLFHIGHLRLLERAKNYCDKLTVGVTTDDLASYKKRNPVIPFEDRIEIVKACKYVDVAIPQTSLDKLEAHARLKFNILFVGDDWFNTKSWNSWDSELQSRGATVLYLPYSGNVSSTSIAENLVK